MPSKPLDRERSSKGAHQWSLMVTQQFQTTPQVRHALALEALFRITTALSFVGDAHNHGQWPLHVSERAQHSGESATRPEDDDSVT